MFSQREIDFMREETDKITFNARCRITRSNQQDSEVDLITLDLIEDPGDILYDDWPCWYQATTRNYERAFEFGEAKTSSRTYIFRFPWHTLGLRVNDTILILDAPDPDFHNRTLTITDPMSSAEGTMRAVIAEIDQGH